MTWNGPEQTSVLSDKCILSVDTYSYAEISNFQIFFSWGRPLSPNF